MVKKLNIFLVLCFTVGQMFSLDWYTELKKNFISPESLRMGRFERMYDYMRVGNILKIQNNDNLLSISPVTYETNCLKIEDLVLNNNTGYTEFVLDDISFNIVLGNEFLLVAPIEKNDWTISMYSEDFNNLRKFQDFFTDKLRRSILIDTLPYNDIIFFTATSSYYTELINNIVIKYDGEKLDSFFITGKHSNGTNVNPYCFPWVENKVDGGIGEWIEIKLKTPQTVTYILNGFVDGTRPHLFKMNSRVKDAEITAITPDGKQLKQEIQFEDFAYFKTVVFSDPVTTIRLMIKSVYPGSKWQDTAISAIMFPLDD